MNCLIDGCASKVLARGYCSRHYQSVYEKMLAVNPSLKKHGRPARLTAEQRADNVKKAARNYYKKKRQINDPEWRDRRRKADARYKKTIEKTEARRKKHIEYVKRYRENLSGERLLRYQERYRKANAAYVMSEKQKESMRVYSREHFQKNKEKYKELRRKWYAEHPLAARMYAHTRRARKRQTGGELSSDIFDRRMKNQKGRCAACRAKITQENAELDHVVALANGGPHKDSNIQLLCATCNRSKGASDAETFMQRKGFLL